MRLIVRVVSCLALVGAAIGGPLLLAPTSAATVQSSVAAIVFPGPSRGTPSTQHPSGSAFVTHCNAAVNSDLGKVGGTAIMTGTAVEATTGCGLAVLPIDVPGQGRFHATFGVSDDDTTGQPGVARVRVLDSDGFYLYTADAMAQKGSPASIDVDVERIVHDVVHLAAAAGERRPGRRDGAARRQVRERLHPHLREQLLEVRAGCEAGGASHLHKVLSGALHSESAARGLLLSAWRAHCFKLAW